MTPLTDRGLALMKELATLHNTACIGQTVTIREIIQIKVMLLEIACIIPSGMHKMNFVEYWMSHRQIIKAMLPPHDHPQVGSFLWRFAEIDDEVNTEIARWHAVSDQLNKF